MGEERLGQRGQQWTETLSTKPMALIYHNFLKSKEECEYLINLAKPHMKRSTVTISDIGQIEISRKRTSTSKYFKRGQDKVIKDIEKRIADYTEISIENGEGLHVVKYQIGQKFEPHHDRNMATLLIYLSDVEEGGETYFPRAIVKKKCDGLSGYTKTKGLYVKPKMGNALLFWSFKGYTTTRDRYSKHGGCAVVKGEKWACIKSMCAKRCRAPNKRYNIDTNAMKVSQEPVTRARTYKLLKDQLGLITRARSKLSKDQLLDINKTRTKLLKTQSRPISRSIAKLLKDQLAGGHSLHTNQEDVQIVKVPLEPTTEARTKLLKDEQPTLDEIVKTTLKPRKTVKTKRPGRRTKQTARKLTS